MSHAAVSDESTAIRLVISDDQVVVAESLQMLLDREEDIDVVGLAHTVAETVSICTRLEPDVVLLDFEFPDGNGADITPQLVGAGAKVVMLSAFADDATLSRSVSCGASGFIPKHADSAAVAAAIRQVAAGEAAISGDLLMRVLPRLGHGAAHGMSSSISEREREVLRMVSTGATNQEIARSLHLSPNTVRNHLSRIYERLGARSRLEAVDIAIREGFIHRRR